MPLTAALMDGTSYYQSGPLYQRYHLAHAITPYQDYLSTPGSLFLIGWSEASSLDASLVGKTPRVQSTSLLINALKPSYQFDQKSLKLPPALFLWSVLEGDVEGFASPYQVRLAQNPMAMRFTLARPLDFQAVESLTVHLVGSDTSSAPLLRLYLWNFATQAWDDQIITGWGNLSISDPQHYVAPGGEVRIRLEPFNDRDEVLLERVDFTLVVQP
jgi:hypothetical protein